MTFKLLKQASQKTFLGAIGAAALSVVPLVGRPMLTRSGRIW